MQKSMHFDTGHGAAEAAGRELELELQLGECSCCGRARVIDVVSP